MANTIIASAVLPGSVDTPLDARSRVSGVPDILNIENPYIGQLVYCTGDGKYYIVRSLKAKQIGVFLVENAAVDRYEEFSPGGGREQLAAADITVADKEELFGAKNVEGVLEELAKREIKAGDIRIENSQSLLEASNVAEALEKLAGKDHKPLETTITLPIPVDDDGDNLSLVLDLSVDGRFENDENGSPVNYCRIAMSYHFSSMRIFRNDAWQTLTERYVGLSDYGSSVEFSLNSEIFPGYLPGAKYYARYKWLDSRGHGDDWTGFSFRSDVVNVRPIRLPDEKPLEVRTFYKLSGTLTFDFVDGDVQNFDLAGDANLDLSNVYNVVAGSALIMNCTPGNHTLTVTNGSQRKMICSGNKVFVIVVTNFGSLQIAVTETI